MREQIKHALRQLNAEQKRDERVVWKFPVLDGIEQRGARLEHVLEVIKAKDYLHPVHLEVSRLVGLYKANLLETLRRIGKHFNDSSRPHIQVTRDPPRWPVEHVAQHIFACMVQEVLIDATEEERLLHPRRS